MAEKPTVDPSAGPGESSAALADTETIVESPKRPPKRRWKYRRWVVLCLLVLGLVWLNGPGLRLLSPQVAVRFLEKAGLRGNFKVQGNLIGGLSISDLVIEGDKELARLTIDKVTPRYQWRGLIKGKLEGLTIDGIHADLRLGLKQEVGKKPPLDLKKLLQTLRTVRGQVMPLDLAVQNVSLAATRDGKPSLALTPSSITHSSGSEDFNLELGTFTDVSGREWPSQKSTIVWNADQLSVPRVDPFPGISLRGLLVQLPAGGEPSVETELHLGDAVFVVTSAPGFASARIDLREGRLLVAEAAGRLGLEIPATATLTSLAVELDQLLPDPKAATGAVRILLEDLAWKDWKSPELSVDATLTAGQTTVAAQGKLLGTGFSIEASAPVARGEKAFSLGEATGKFNIADVPQALRELAARVPAIDPEAPVPPSTVDGNFTIAIAANQPQSAAVDLVLKPKDDTLASPVAVKARWSPDQPLAADLALDGLTAAATYQIKPGSYQATVGLDEFTNTRIDRWLASFRVKPGGVANLSGTWSGSGEVKAGKHRGDLSLTQATWTREAAAPVTAIGGVKYDWPAGFETRGLRIQMNEQTVVLDAALADGLLQLRDFLWSDGKTEFATGTASLPVPADFSQWRDTLANDTRPVSVSINSRVLSLGLLKLWIPALEKLDPRSTGQLDIAVSGTYSEPVVDAKFEAKELRSPSQPKLPPADLKITLAGRDGRIELDGSATAPDFAPAVLKANMPFRPAEWAKAPGLIKEEPLDARVDLPRLDLSRFSSLVPSAELVKGIVTGNVLVAGTVGKPVMKGTLDLTDGGLGFKNEKFPATESVTAKVELALDRIDLKSLQGTVAGGTFQSEGSLAIGGGRLGDLDIRLRGNHLPLLRNDLLILRANADLRLQGPWDRVALTGTAGAVDGIFYRDIELLPIGSPFTTPSAKELPKFDSQRNPAATIPEPFRNWTLNVQVRTEEPLLIRGNFATGEVTGSLRLGGTVGTPAPDGVFTIKDFRADLPFSKLSVRSGTATFTPANGFDPVLDLRGTSEPRPYRVEIFAYGRASDPQLLLTSSPPLPENEIMTLLATGTTTTGLVDSQAASSRALQLLAEEVRRGRFRFGKQLRPLLGMLDKVDFGLNEKDPYSSDSFSTATVSLTDRWFLSAGMSASGDSRALVIWRLSFH